ncbi:YolD-like family protein [Bacillus cereus]|uniref:YolD-like family protein n=1 Tax=Bacillus cereus TaxID=1396 RepID=UPI003D17EA29
MAKFSSKDKIQAVKRYLEGTEGGFLLTNYMTVVDIDPLNKSIICTDAFYNNMNLKFIDIIDAK